MNLVLFDFDGTLTRKDTFIEFIRFYKGDFRFLAGLLVLSPVMAAYTLKLIPNWRAKEILFGFYFKGTPQMQYEEKGKEFAMKVLPSLIRASTENCLAQYKKEGHQMVIVTASAEEWIRPWAELKGVTQILATKWEVSSGRLTGKISGRNCYGPEKRERIQKELDLSKYKSIIVYGDTSGDKEMLELGDQKFYKHFKD